MRAPGLRLGRGCVAVRPTTVSQVWTALESVETRALGARAFSRAWMTPRGRRPGGPFLSSFLYSVGASGPASPSAGGRRGVRRGPTTAGTFAFGIVRRTRFRTLRYGRGRRRQVGGLVLRRREVAEGAVQTLAVPPGHPSGGGHRHLGDRPPRGAAADQLGLVQAVDRLGQ